MVGRGRPRGRGRPTKQRRDGRERPKSLAECFRMRCGELLDRVQKKDTLSIFLEPVDVSEAPEYDTIIRRPMDLTTIRKRLATDSYVTLSGFHEDLNLIWSNCLTYNGPEPSNIYSKKAIELKKLTDRLIPTVKVGLEHDREVYDQWMERHRRKTHPAASPSSSAVGLRFAADPAYPPNNLLGPSAATPCGPGANTAAPDQSGTTLQGGPAAGVDPPYSSTAVVSGGLANTHADSADPAAAAHLLILARREALRDQYGTSGLYRPQSAVASDDFVFLASDLPDFRPSSLRYNPHSRHADAIRQDSASAPVLRRRLDLSNLRYRSLGTRPRSNPCRPIVSVDSIRVKDYIQSLQTFVSGAGVIASKIVSELVSPELTVKRAEEERKKRKREAALICGTSSSPGSAVEHVSELGSCSVRNSEGERPLKQVALGNERSLRPVPLGGIRGPSLGAQSHNGTQSLLPKLSQQIPELDGIDGLEILIGSKLADEVRAIRVEAVDFSMPYGVSPDEMNNIAQVANIWRSRDAPDDLSFLLMFKHETDQHSRRLAALGATGSMAYQKVAGQQPGIPVASSVAGKSSLNSNAFSGSPGLHQSSVPAPSRPFNFAPVASSAVAHGLTVPQVSGTIGHMQPSRTIGHMQPSGQPLLQISRDQAALQQVRHGPENSLPHRRDLSLPEAHGQSQRNVTLSQSSTPVRQAALPVSAGIGSTVGNKKGTSQARKVLEARQNLVNSSVAMAAERGKITGAEVGLGTSEGRVSICSGQPVPPAGTKIKNLLPGSAVCENCHDQFRTGWRQTPGPVERLCSECGNYFIKNRRMRPRDLWAKQMELPVQARVQQPTRGVEHSRPSAPPSSSAQLQFRGKLQNFSTSQAQMDFTPQHHNVALSQNPGGGNIAQDTLHAGAQPQNVFGTAIQQQVHSGPVARSGTDTLNVHQVAKNSQVLAQALPQPLHGPFPGGSQTNIVSNLMVNSPAQHSGLTSAQHLYQQQTIPHGYQQRSLVGQNGAQSAESKQPRRPRPKKKKSASTNRETVMSEVPSSRALQIGGNGPVSTHEGAQSASPMQPTAPSGGANAPLSGGGYQSSQALDFLAPQQVQEFIRIQHRQLMNAPMQMFEIPQQGVAQDVQITDQQLLEQQRTHLGAQQPQSQVRTQARQSENQRRQALRKARLEAIPKDVDKQKNRDQRSPLNPQLQLEAVQPQASPCLPSSHSIYDVQAQVQDPRNSSLKSQVGHGLVGMPSKQVAPRPFDKVDHKSVSATHHLGQNALQEAVTQGSTGLVAGSNEAGASHLHSKQHQINALQEDEQQEGERVQERLQSRTQSNLTKDVQRLRTQIPHVPPHHEIQARRMSQRQPPSAAESRLEQPLQNSGANRSHAKRLQNSPAIEEHGQSSSYQDQARFGHRVSGHDVGSNNGATRSPDKQSQLVPQAQSQLLPVTGMQSQARLSGNQLTRRRQHETSVEHHGTRGAQLPSSHYIPGTIPMAVLLPNGNQDYTSDPRRRDERNEHVFNPSHAAPLGSIAMLPESLRPAGSTVDQRAQPGPGQNVRAMLSSSPSEDRLESQQITPSNDARRLVPAINSAPTELSHENSHQSSLHNIHIPATAVGPTFVNSIHALMATSDGGRFEAGRASVAEENMSTGHEVVGITNLTSGLQQSMPAFGTEFMMSDVMHANVPANVQDENGGADTEQHMVQSLFYGHGIGDGGRSADDDLSGDPDFGF